MNDCKKLISDVVDKLFFSYGLKIKLGVEIEFYCKGNIADLDKSYLEFLQKEKGTNQFELAFHPSVDIMNVISEVVLFQEYANNNIYVDISPKPYAKDHGSAMHVHLSLYKEDSNVFQCYADNIINIILEFIPYYTYSILNKKDDYSRLHDFLHTTPSTVSWGDNNRTTLIRLPRSCYKNKRLEFRLASACSDVNEIVMFLIQSVLYSCENAVTLKHKKIYGNSFDQQYDLKKLPTSLEEAKKMFQKRRLFGSF